MVLFKNELGQKKLAEQVRQRKLQRVLALVLIVAAIACLFAPGWFKLLSIPLLAAAVLFDHWSQKNYDQVFYHERDKGRLAFYLQQSLNGYRVFVNPPVCNPVPDLIVIGSTGIFVITVTADISYGMKQQGDLQALAVRDALQARLPSYPVDTVIFVSEALLLKPAVSRVSIVSSYFALINHIKNNNQRLSRAELKAVADFLAS